MMLIGALAYALPETQEFVSLLPAVAGIVIATGGMVAGVDKHARPWFLRFNALAAILMVIFVLKRFGHDWGEFQAYQLPIISDCDILMLAMVFLACGMREVSRSRNSGTQAVSDR